MVLARFDPQRLQDLLVQRDGTVELARLFVRQSEVDHRLELVGMVLAELPPKDGERLLGDLHGS